MKVETFPYLRSQRVNLQLLQEAACTELFKVLDKCTGSNVIALDDSLLGPFGLIASTSFFAERNIKLLKISAATEYPRDVNNIIYIVRPNMELMNIISDHVQQNDDSKYFYHLYFVSRKSCVCIKHLENLGALGNFATIDEIPWNFFPIDSDVLSMELPQSFGEVTIDGDPSSLYQAAIGLVQLQKIYGRIPKIYGKGNAANKVWEFAKQLGTEDKTMFNAEKGAIDQMIVLDRSIDLMSVLATQLTYEGLIDEFYGIAQNRVALPAELFASGRNADDPARVNLANEKKTLILNSAEKLYVELRDKNFNEVGKILSRNAKEISAQMGSSSQDKTVQDMKRLVDKLPELLTRKQSVAVHTSVAEVIRRFLDGHAFADDLNAEQEFMMCEDIDKPSAYIEGLIAKKCELRNVLRLMCLQCAAASGFKEKVFNYYKRELAHVYGIEVLLTISDLEKAGLLRTQSENRSYAVLRKTLNLTVDDALEVEPRDLSYVHSFYAPLTARIVEFTLKPLGWQSLKGQLNNLPGQTFEDFQAQLIGIGGRQSFAPGEGSSLNIPRVELVFFVGGCTFAEIAALRFLSQQEDNNVEFVIATTKIVNKNTFLDHLIKAK